MGSATGIGRVGGLAVALGIGAWLASVPWSAAASSDDVGLDDLLHGSGLDGLLGLF